MKYVIIIISIFLLTGCNKNVPKEIKLDKKMDISSYTYVDNNPITVGIYNDADLVHEFNTKYTNMHDIASFNIYYTNNEKLKNNRIKENWNKYYKQYDNIDNYKIGFDISFRAEGKDYYEEILTPDCEFLFSPYIYIYLYDGIHQSPGKRYSHITMDKFNDETIFSGIKLFMADQGEKIESPITLSVFTYDDDDFDNNKKYIGKSRYTITINNK